MIRVCSTWRAVSRSELLWQNLTRHIWNNNHLSRSTWREEFIYLHCTANNFRLCRYVYTTLHFVLAEDDNNNDNNNHDISLSCRRLALSGRHLAAGFADGIVRLFHLASRVHLATFRPQHRDRLGRYSRAVSGIILSDTHLTFATLDGDIHVADLNHAHPPRRAHLGDVVNDGALVDFTGCGQWWVGLYAGVPGCAFHIWNNETEELVFVGGSLTDPEAVLGWHLLTELTDLIGRIRVASNETAVAVSSLRMVVFDLRHQGVVLGDEQVPHTASRQLVVGSADVSDDTLLIVDRGGRASIRRVGTLEETCTFLVVRGAEAGTVASSQRVGRLLGCTNGGYAILFVGNVIDVWDIEQQHGHYLYSLAESIGEANVVVADQRHIVAAAATSPGTINLWDFGPQ
ncbi:hypothetical protein Leryth_019144 [Lithospermum erythrorhizon]|nr:hypothetical protein Leryth_019144 [Lithospermum erythrorhizon]